MQKRLSAAIDLAAATRLAEELPPPSLARLKCCQSVGGALWLTLPYEVCSLLWLTSGDFRTLARMRLGLPLSDGCSMCVSCARVMTDAYGKHNCCCMSGPFRTSAHNAVRDTVVRLAAFALLGPEKESMCFPNSQQRMDIVLKRGFAGVAQLVDVAITYPLREDVLQIAITDGCDAVATAYTEVKYATYGRLVAHGQAFTPLVFDMFGGMSAKGRILLGKIATAYGLRCPEGVRHGRLKFYAILNRAVAVEVAQLASRA
jgi:hypothetical protein